MEFALAGCGMREECDEVAAFGVKQTFKKMLKKTWLVRQKQGVKEWKY